MTPLERAEACWKLIDSGQAKPIPAIQDAITAAEKDIQAACDQAMGQDTDASLRDQGLRSIQVAKDDGTGTLIVRSWIAPPPNCILDENGVVLQKK